MLERAIELFEASAKMVPLEVFAFFGAIVEEIIAPIPSPLLGTLAGSIAAAQNKTFWYLVLIGVISAIGKTIGCLIFYFAADKAEDFFTSKFGKFVGVTHKDIEGIGQRFKGGWKDEVALFFIRFAPFMPTTPISVACGIIKMPLKSYIGATLLGTFFRGMIYLYLGYMGESSSTALVKNFNGAESLIQILILLMILAVFGLIIYKKKKVAKASETQ